MVYVGDLHMVQLFVSAFILHDKNEPKKNMLENICTLLSVTCASNSKKSTALATLMDEPPHRCTFSAKT